MLVEIWSDVVCPWCWIGKRRFERALAVLPNRDRVQVTYRSFELHPSLPKGQVLSRRSVLMSKYGLTEAEARSRDDNVARQAEDEGLHYVLETVMTGNTFDAHRLLHLAKDRRLQNAVLERFYHAYFTEQRSLFDDESLIELAREAGLDDDAARDVLREGTYADAVRNDRALASARRITTVPFFVIDRRVELSGARLPEVFLEALVRAGATVQ